MLKENKQDSYSGKLIEPISDFDNNIMVGAVRIRYY